jgi:uncharacterized protein GlcG (DUF336 family)
MRHFATPLALMIAAAAMPARAEMLMHHGLPSAVALTIAQEVVANCAAKAYAESAMVVDRDGETIVAIRGDNAGLHTMETRGARPTPRSSSASRRLNTRRAMSQAGFDKIADQLKLTGAET